MNQGNPNGNTAEFFNTSISQEDFARNMRNFMHAALMLNFQNTDKNFNPEIESGYFWLTKFCEQIDPVLTKAENQKELRLMKK